ncbi:MAG: hypothetical protein KBS89_06200, partial [Bacteroidales bacterium]|nr:hypothetical protein [Candidatus Egerieousia equi]
QIIMCVMIKKLFEYYLAHQDELVEKYSGKYLVIKWPRNEHIFGQMAKISPFRRKIADISAVLLKPSEKVPVFRT